MKFLLTIFLFFFYSCEAQEFFPARLIQRIPITTFSGKTLRFEGNSITAGLGLGSPTTSRWPKLLSDEISATEDNNGLSGYRLTQGVACGEHPAWDYTNIPTYNSGTHGPLYINYGPNDIGVTLAGATASVFQSSYETIVDYAHNTKGWPYNQIVLSTPTNITNYTAYVGHCGGAVTDEWDDARWEAFRQAVISVAQSRHTVLADVGQAMKDYATPSALLTGDGIHPNETGHVFIKDYLMALDYSPQ